MILELLLPYHLRLHSEFTNRNSALTKTFHLVLLKEIEYTNNRAIKAVNILNFWIAELS